MLTLYHCHDARSFRPLWTLEEMGLSYELKMLPFPPRAAAPDYLSVNPLGTVPTFFDGNMRMTESAAICQYLVTRYGPTPLAVEASEPDFGPYLNWLYFGGDRSKWRRIIPNGFFHACAVWMPLFPNNRQCVRDASPLPTSRSVSR
jgi:glutathione S-transferase